MEKVESSIFQSFMQAFPYMAETVVSYKQISDRIIEVKYEDASVGVFDELTGTFRYVPKEKIGQLTKTRWTIELGHSIYRAMLEKGMTMRDLSNVSGIEYTTLSRYINGHKSPSSYTLYRIARGLGLNLGDLTDFTKYFKNF